MRDDDGKRKYTYKFVPKVETNKLLEYINVSEDNGDIFDDIPNTSLLDVGIK